MFFNSIEFAIFLLIFFILYWTLASKKLRLQNLFIAIGSYVFYGWWDWRFLSLIISSTIVDYSVGCRLEKEKDEAKRKILLWVSILFNLGVLGVFKYFDFFVDNFIAVFSLFGGEVKVNSLNIILPVGISFYSFQTLSYSIDVYRHKLIPTKDFVAFSAYVSFFPQLVAGPIERATSLLPQFHKKRIFNYPKAVDGMRQILWGLFKKIVIADNCAEYADLFFNNSSEYPGSALVLGALFFTFQIYCDFSGYSDIAIGTAKLFGLDLMKNFAFPYFSRDVAEFWRRWHISLSTWFRDYVYIPLGGSHGGIWKQIRNTFIIFVVSGFWHGANWTFIIWGTIHATYFLPLLLTKNNRKDLDIVAKGQRLPNIQEVFRMLSTFSLIVLAWIFFRAHSVGHAITYLSQIFTPSLFTFPYFPGMGKAFIIVLLIKFFIFIEWQGREKSYPLAHLGDNLRQPFRYIAYYFIVFLIMYYGNFSKNQFIYFQF